MSSRLTVAIAITFAVVILTALSVWVLHDVVKNNGARVDIDGVDTKTRAVAPFEGLTEARLQLDDKCLRVAVADTLSERNRGLREVRDLSPYDGMLFVFGADTDARFTMAGTPLTLDIGWYAADGNPVDRTTMKPCLYGDDATCPVYASKTKYRYALETNGGHLGGGALHGCSA